MCVWHQKEIHVFSQRKGGRQTELPFSVCSFKSRGGWLRNWRANLWFCSVSSLHKPQLPKKRGTCGHQTVEALSWNENSSESLSYLSSSKWGLFHSWIALPWGNYVDNTKMLSKFLRFSPFFLTTITFKWSLSVGHLNECSQKPKLVIQLKATKVHLSSLLTCKLHLLRGQHFLVRAKDQIQSDHWNSLFCLLG